MNVTEAGIVTLSSGHQALVDVADLDSVNGYNWHLLKGHRGKLYAYTGRVYMHRLIANTPQGFETDHVNGDGLDNRRANLRIATPSQNRANTGKPSRPDGGSHTSQFKGVSWDRSRQKWQSKIHHNGRQRLLGRYGNEADAARAYDAAAHAAWGHFAVLNFPTEVSA